MTDNCSIQTPNRTWLRSRAYNHYRESPPRCWFRSRYTLLPMQPAHSIRAMHFSMWPVMTRPPNNTYIEKSIYNMVDPAMKRAYNMCCAWVWSKRDFSPPVATSQHWLSKWLVPPMLTSRHHGGMVIIFYSSSHCLYNVYIRICDQKSKETWIHLKYIYQYQFRDVSCIISYMLIITTCSFHIEYYVPDYEFFVYWTRN